MRALELAVLGAGVAGLAAALALARDGHRVTFIERDNLDAQHADDPLSAVGWQRRGIPQFLQPHAFIPRGRMERRGIFPDVFAAFLAAGAWTSTCGRKSPALSDPRCRATPIWSTWLCGGP